MKPTAVFCDFTGRTVLVTGGTKGIGLATGLAFGRRGASVLLTNKWGSVSASEIEEHFVRAGASRPLVLEADASREDDVVALLHRVGESHSGIDILVSNVAFGPATASIDAYTRRGLSAAIDYSVWPIVSHTRAIKARFGRYPKYVLGMSSEGIDSYQLNYDLVAAAKAALEALCRYMHHRLREHGTSVNVIRTHFTSTESLRAIFGDAFEPFVRLHAPGLFTEPQEVAEAAVGMCSGLMDAVGGQVVTIDKGAAIFDNLSRLFDERGRLPPISPKTTS